MITLEYQVEAIDRAATEVAVKVAAGHSDRRQVSLDVQERVDSAIHLFQDMQRTTLRWQAQTELTPQAIDASLPFARELEGHYKTLSSACEKIGKLVPVVESWGQVIDRKVEYRHAARSTRGICSVPVDRIHLSMQQVDRGEVVPLEDVIREIRAKNRESGR